jgi:hypothetical protein
MVQLQLREQRRLPRQWHKLRLLLQQLLLF